MSLANGQPYLAIPGPSVPPERVLRAMHRTSPNIYEGELTEMVPGIARDLKAVASCSGEVAIYIANGHGAWEAALANTHSRGDKVLVLATGRFAVGWAAMARALGIEVDIIDFGLRSDIDREKLAEVLAADTAHVYKSVLAVHVDTSTSVKNDIKAVREVLNACGHPALLMVDCIASLACDRYDMDGWGVDVTVAGCQKGLMTPPGLAFVFFNAKADAARDRADCVTSYWDWRPRCQPRIFYEFFGGTAPTHHLYGLREALDMIAEEGLEAVYQRHEMLARAVWAAHEAWSTKGPLSLNVTDRALRSVAVTSVHLGGRDGKRLQDWTRDRTGLTLGIGLGMSENASATSDGHYRVGHMGHVNAHMVLGTLAVIESGLNALGLEYGPGALSSAADVCSEA